MFGKRPTSESATAVVDRAAAGSLPPPPSSVKPPVDSLGLRGRAHAVSLRRPRRAADRRADRQAQCRARRCRPAAAAGPERRRLAPLGILLRGQGHDFRRPDRGDRPRATGQARRRFRARGNSRHRQRNHRDQKYRDVDLRAGGSARRHLQRRARLRAAGAAAGPRRDRRHHGERLGHGLHRSRRQNSEDRHPLSRQSATPQHLPAHRQPGRPARRRILADLRRALAGRLARQRHRAAAGDRRPGAHHPQIQEGQADAGTARQVRIDLARRRRDSQGHRALPGQHADLRRYRLGQDHAAQLPHALHRRRRAHRHLRRRRRTAIAATARGAAGDPAAKSRRRGPGHDARSGARTACVCDRSESSSARCADPKPSTCCRR